MTTEAAQALDRQLTNAARRWDRRGNQDKAEAYRYAASLVRQAMAT